MLPLGLWLTLSLQEVWINNHHPDTRMAGVLSPIQKTMVTLRCRTETTIDALLTTSPCAAQTMIGRLEESVCGKTDDSALATIYHRLLPATLQWLEKVADSKPKYASLVRLGRSLCVSTRRHRPLVHSRNCTATENYYFISDRLAGINVALDLPLGQYAAEARAKFEKSAQQYVAYIWVYEFKQLEVRPAVCTWRIGSAVET